MSGTRHRIYAILLAIGASVLLGRTLVMLAGGALSILVVWASALLILECSIDATTLGASLRWWATGDE